MLSVKNLTIAIEQKNVLKNFSMHVAPGSLHVIMGQNGCGKSSFAHTLMGMTNYEIIDGSMIFADQNLQEFSLQQRSLLGIFLAFQQPLTIPGVTVFQFLKEICAVRESKLPQEFLHQVTALFDKVGLDHAFLYRGLNENFSGGEKKRLEIVQMLLLKPKLVILDEIDSGLDVDALRIIGSCVHEYLQQEPQASCIVITHYRRILDYLQPTAVHVMYDGAIVRSGGVQLSYEIEQQGYDAYIL